MLNTCLTHVKQMFNRTHVLYTFFTHLFNICTKHVFNILKIYTLNICVS